MKAIVIDNNFLNCESQDIISWHLLADSAVSNSGKPFFIPENEDEILAYPVIVVKVSRLGKTINQKFSHRYYEEIAPGVNFVNASKLKYCIDHKLSYDPAFSFDKALICDGFIKKDNISENTFFVIKNTEETKIYDIDNFIFLIDYVISEISKTNTLKMGDFVVIGNSKPLSLKIGDTLRILTDGEETFKIKVK